jgi:hypothetical protein
MFVFIVLKKVNKVIGMSAASRQSRWGLNNVVLSPSCKLDVVQSFSYTIKIIHLDKDLYVLPAYKLILHLGYADIMSIITNFIAGLIMLIVIDQTNAWGFWFIKVCEVVL